VRHSYATAGRAKKIDWKALSHRIGHADVALTMKQYVQTDLEADRQVANTLATLIIGGSLVTAEIAGAVEDVQIPLAGMRERRREPRSVSKSVSIRHAKGPFPDRKGPLALVAGAGFEPATSGL
jgi:hypothetical protein